MFHSAGESRSRHPPKTGGSAGLHLDEALSVQESRGSDGGCCLRWRWTEGESCEGTPKLDPAQEGHFQTPGFTRESSLVDLDPWSGTNELDLQIPEVGAVRLVLWHDRTRLGPASLVSWP